MIINVPVFLAVLGALTAFYFFIGLYASRTVTSTSDYFLAGRSLGLFAVTATLIATQLGGGMLLGTCQEAYITGFYGILYTLGMSIGFILLASGLAARMQSMNVATVAEIFETHYNSLPLKKIASLLSILTLCGIFVGQVVASRTILSGLSITHEWIFLLIWGVIITYTMIGGLKAVVLTDTFQVIFIIIVFSGIFIYALSGEPSSFFSYSSLLALQKNFTNISLNARTLIATLVMPALFSLIQQDLAQRFFSARSRSVAAGAALCASVFLLTFALIPVYLGIKARILGLALAPTSSPLLPVIGYLTNQWVLIFALCAVMAAITSTADSLLCAISSNVAQDFNTSRNNTKNALWRSKIITLVIGVLGVGASYFVPQNILQVLVGSYELSVSCLLVPLVFAYFSKNVHRCSAWAAIITGFGAFMIMPYFYYGAFSSILPTIFSLIAYIGVAGGVRG